MYDVRKIFYYFEKLTCDNDNKGGSFINYHRSSFAASPILFMFTRDLRIFIWDNFIFEIEIKRGPENI